MVILSPSPIKAAFPLIQQIGKSYLDIGIFLLTKALHQGFGTIVSQLADDLEAREFPRKYKNIDVSVTSSQQTEQTLERGRKQWINSL